MIDLLRSIHHYSSHFAQFPRLLQGIAQPHPGCAPPGKSRAAIALDHLYLFFVLKVVPVNYYLFEFQFKDRKHFREYMDETVAPLLKHRFYKCLWNDSYSSLVNDKHLFHCLCRYHGISVPELYGMCARLPGDNDPCLVSVMDARGLDRVILKPRGGVQGRGIYFARRNGRGIELKAAATPEVAPGGDFIVQEVIGQHPRMEGMNPFCLNTIRLITLLTRDGEVEFLAAMLRTSSDGTAVDNFSLGGIVVGVDIETGKLKERGFQKTTHAVELRRHPLTGVVFKGFEVPYWNEVKETAAKAQKVFSELKTIGWDLAVSPSGPVMIEGNIEWGTTGIQATNGGLLTQKNRALFARYGLTFHT
ncbi:MAG TPA: sugar-transfer associated ATP-grasp domain-containing protein [Syntrophorhabdaceae bacterium]|nr:sugar-transfer associated ATP-grasp domain-containing protein [Syntrophorhabdaceae bacterium]